MPKKTKGMRGLYAWAPVEYAEALAAKAADMNITPAALHLRLLGAGLGIKNYEPRKPGRPRKGGK